jgi:hypothetical protein
MSLTVKRPSTKGLPFQLVAQSHCTQLAVIRVRSAGGEIQTVVCEARYARGRAERAQ